jgi:two-component system chemotaxis sensor kinase CheA
LALDEEQLKAELARAFEEEARGLAQRSGELILALESAGRQGAQAAPQAEALARLLHTLKGSAAICGLNEASRLAHAMEDALAQVLAGRQGLGPEQADGMLASLDALLAAVRPAAPREVALPSAAPDEEAGPEQGAEDPRLTPARSASLQGLAERVRSLALGLEARARGGTPGLAGLAQSALDTARDLEEELDTVGTLALSDLVPPLRRAVRDLARDLGKQAELSVVGGDLRVDRRMAAALRAPLLHLVRNALDHGIEAPQARDAAGKHSCGALVIRAERQGNLLSLEVADDGAGVDTARVRQRALETALLPPELLEGLDNNQVAQLLFSPGFSTRSTVGKVSGRGVGLDVVRSQARALGGDAYLVSRPGQGTRVQVSVPLRQGALPVLLAQCGPALVALPLAAVAACGAAPKEGLGGRQVRLRGMELEPADLAGLLRLRYPRPAWRGRPLLAVQHEERLAGVWVDAVLEEGERRVLPLPRALGSQGVYQGAVVLPQGGLAPLLRPDWLVEAALDKGQAQALGRRRQALVVDDSLAARAMQRTLLEAMGWEVHLARGAAEALESAQSCDYEAVVCDWNMPGMPGPEILQRLRKEKGRRAVLVLVSAEGALGLAEAAHRAGADAWFSKQECAEGRLGAYLERALRDREEDAWEP